MWSLVEFFWMSVNLLLIAVIYRHTSTIAGWNKYEMMLLVGTSLLIQRFPDGVLLGSILIWAATFAPAISTSSWRNPAT